MLGFESVELKGGGNALRFRPEGEDGYVLVKNGHEDRVPSHPESEAIRIEVFDRGDTKLSSVQVRGRVGLNDWFEQSAGYRPDDERFRPTQIDELIRMVCTEMLSSRA